MAPLPFESDFSPLFAAEFEFFVPGNGVPDSLLSPFSIPFDSPLVFFGEGKGAGEWLLPFLVFGNGATDCTLPFRWIGTGRGVRLAKGALDWDGRPNEKGDLD